jgi:hypothetical protein
MVADPLDLTNIWASRVTNIERNHDMITKFAMLTHRIINQL